MTARKHLAMLALAVLLAQPLAVTATCAQFDEAQAACPGHCPMSEGLMPEHPASTGPMAVPSEQPCCEVSSPASLPSSVSPALVLSNGPVAPAMHAVTLPGDNLDRSPHLHPMPVPAPAGAASPQALLCVFLF